MGSKYLETASSPFSMSSFAGVFFPATTVSMEKAFSASDTDMVPRADKGELSALQSKYLSVWAVPDDLRPENGNTSGERPHCVLMLTLPTAVDKMSRSGPADAAFEVNIAACWPYGVSEMNE